MIKNIELKVRRDELSLDKSQKSIFSDLFSGARINFLFGAGFSCEYLGLLGNYENLLLKTSDYEPNNESERKLLNLTLAFIYWSYFKSSMYPLNVGIDKTNSKFLNYNDFGENIKTILKKRSNTVLDKQANIFTTNYDPLLEVIFDSNKDILYNDGFEGRIEPSFSVENFSKLIYKKSIFTEKKTELPLVNIYKTHGSLTWRIANGSDSDIVYKNYRNRLLKFWEKYDDLFDEDITNYYTQISKLNSNDFSEVEINDLVNKVNDEDILSSFDEYLGFLEDYKRKFLIINPTKEKFNTTLMNRIYYDLLRIYSNELEKDNTLFISFGFSFRDEHILDITKRSLINPSLRFLVFAYNEEQSQYYERIFRNVKSNCLTIIRPENNKILNLSILNQLMLSVVGDNNV